VRTIQTLQQSGCSPTVVISRGRSRWPGLPRRERGIIVFVALIALVVMMVAGIALMRSVDTGNLIAGNLAFRQRAVHSADAGVELARQWLVNNNTGTMLYADLAANGYYAEREDPTTWAAFFQGATPPTTFTDPAGNAVTYVIHRLCSIAGDPSNPANACATTVATGSFAAGNSKAAGRLSVNGTVQMFYRVTVQVVAPRKTVSYIQTVVAL
jgi:type IV pilus assembly protein PilX